MFSKIRIKDSNIYNNGYDYSTWPPGGIWSMWFAYIDARGNWWGAENGPKLCFYIYDHILLPLRLRADGDKIIFSRSIYRIRPWVTEPISDAGVN